MNLEQVNQNLRTGGIRSLVLLSTLTAANAILMAQRLSNPETPSHWAWVGLSTLLGTVVIALTWSALRGLQTHLTDEGLIVNGPGQPASVPWKEVVRVRSDAWRIILERTGAPAAVISLWYVSRPDDLHHAIRTLVPNRALQQSMSDRMQHLERKVTIVRRLGCHRG
jgi:hypothetical protein